VSRRIRIAVLAGGRSSEHAISLDSARSVIDALDPARYDVLCVLIDERGGWKLLADGGSLLAPPASQDGAESTALVPGRGARALETRSGVGASFGEVDVVFPVLHGPFGEDGTVQGLLETVDLPYVGAGVLGSAVAMDKDVCKAVLRDAGIATARSITLRDHACDPDDPAVAARIGAALGWPVFVKPATLGSSVGISKVAGPRDLAAALVLSFRHDPKALVEEHVGGRELECGVLGNERAEASAVGEIRPGGDWYDFAAKYDEGGSDIVIPAPLDPATTAEVQRMALAAFAACECAGMARVDFFLRPDGVLLLNEVNTIPGFTATSVYARLFAETGVSYSRLLDRLVELALERHAARSRYRF
jgi:D-alanine-D-alanine ligase